VVSDITSNEIEAALIPNSTVTLSLYARGGCANYPITNQAIKLELLGKNGVEESYSVIGNTSN